MSNAVLLLLPLLLFQVGNALPKAADNCHDFCPKIYDPWCGSDNVTYDNICELQRLSCKAGVKVHAKYAGTCGNPSACPAKCNIATNKIDPVCGSDGKTRPNMCTMEHHFCQSRGDIVMTRKGMCGCQSNTPAIFCPQQLCSAGRCPRVPSALCMVGNCNGCTLQFYDKGRLLNYCECFDCQTTTPKVPDGTCKDPCKFSYCPRYPSASCRQSKKDSCKPVFYFLDKKEMIIPKGGCGKICTNDCTRVYSPVCGTNGKTYVNRCDLNNEKCRNKGDFKVLHVGPCKQKKTQSNSDGTSQ